MTKDEIISMAREAGFNTEDHHAIYANLKYLVELVATAERRKHQADIERWQEAAEKEREACAQTCEERHANGNYQHDTRHECAEAIRARGQQ